MAETVVINFTGKDDVSSTAKGVEKSIQDVGTAAQSQGPKFDGLTEIARGAFQSIGAFAVNAASQIGSSIIGGIGSFITEGIEEAAGWQSAFRQTQAVVESTGMAAGFTAEQMGEMAQALSASAGASLFTDDQILGAQNVLATFTKVQGIQFEGATQSALDMAQALGMDVSSAAMMMGKALNDPVKGLSALSRSGVSFTEEQKAMVEAMVEAGDVAGAQNLILKEMEVQFGGSALAATETFAGSQVLLQEAFNGVKETLGTALLPVLTGFANVTMSFIIPALEKMITAAAEFISGLDWTAITTSISGIINGFISFISTIPWSDIFTALGTFADFLMSQIPTAMTILQPVIDAVIGIVQSLIGVFTSPEMQSIAGNVMQIFGVIAGVFGTLIAAITPIITQIIESVQRLMPPIAIAVQMITDTLANPTLIAAFNNIAALFSVVGQLIVQLAEIYIAALIAKFMELWPTVETVINAIGTVINAVVPTITGIIQSLVMYLNGDTAGALTNLQNVFSTAWAGIQIAVQTGIDAVKTKLQEWISGAAQFGTDLVNGIASGISSSAGKIADAAKGAAQSALDAAKALLGIASPSKVMAKQVGLPIGEGMAAGIMSSIPAIRGAMAVSLGSAQGQATQSIQNYYLTANYATSQSESTIRNDLRAMQLLSGAV